MFRISLKMILSFFIILLSDMSYGQVCQYVNSRTTCSPNNINTGTQWSIKCSEIPVMGRPVCLSMEMVRNPQTGYMIQSQNYGKWVQTNEMQDLSEGAANCYMPVTGYASCASTHGSVPGDVSNQLITNSTVDPNIFCWCKMASPGTSPWVFANGNYNSTKDCRNICSQMCATFAVNNCSFRAALFSNL